MTSDSEQKKIATELKQILFKRQQLLERKKILCIFQELRIRADFEETEETVSCQHEIDSIDENIKELSDRIAELEKCHDDNLSTKDEKEKEVGVSSSENTGSSGPESKIVYVEAPPSIPAPKVILDLKDLPPCPCKTQCPECAQYVVTETYTSVSSVTWMVCFITAMVGCVAGCCFIPFCLNRFKNTIHRCPKCRTSIHTVKKL